MKGKSGTDIRRAISPQVWLANRARNALHRPAFIGAISVGTFVTALVSMVVVPRAQRNPEAAIPTVPRPDTLTVAGTAALARVKLAQADSALEEQRSAAADEAARLQAEAARARALSDSLAMVNSTQRDSMRVRLDALDRMSARAEQAPLPASYRALAEMPDLRMNPRVRALVDSLAEIEAERDGYSTVGGVDPMFVSLTNRVNEIGRSIRGIADERRAALRAQLEGLVPVIEVAAVPTVDTATSIASRDSVRQTLDVAMQELARRRAISHDLDLQEERARERAHAVAPPLALLAAAFVLSAVIGFATAFLRELRQPRVSSATELERYLGVRVLSSVETPMPSVDRGRRHADRSAPPYFDPGSEGYQLAYLGLATDHPALLSVTVTGDEPAIAAVIACNLAAVASHEARSTLVIDMDPSCSASSALRARVEPGISDLVRGDVSWPDATVSARVGRDRTVDLVPHGLKGTPTAASVVELLQRDSSRLGRYHDAIFVLARPDQVVAGIPAALPSAEVVYCAQPGITPLRALRQQLEEIRKAGGSLRGVVLWNAERPLLPTPPEVASRSRRRQKAPEAALVAS